MRDLRGSRTDEVPRLVAITPDVSPDECLEGVGRLVSAGCPAVLLRLPGLSAAALLDTATKAVSMARGTVTRILVSDRADVAALSGAAGVHLPGHGLRPYQARKVVGPDALVGVSCHDVQDCLDAAADGADYVFLSPIFHTRSHPDRQPLGEITLARAVNAAGVPVLALGGVTVRNIHAVARAGAHGAALLSGLWPPPDPATTLVHLLEALAS